jgi:hypothetical protein
VGARHLHHETNRQELACRDDDAAQPADQGDPEVMNPARRSFGQVSRRRVEGAGVVEKQLFGML